MLDQGSAGSYSWTKDDVEFTDVAVDAVMDEVAAGDVEEVVEENFNGH